MGNQNDISAESVELDTQDGVAFIEQASPLTRLHYFDGKFLKADALAQEQAYHRTQVQLANVAGGWGVVHGLGVRLSGDQITVSGGLAITPAGHFVMAVGEVQAGIAALLKVASPAPAVTGHADFAPCEGKSQDSGVQETAALGLYEITVGPIEGLCGNEPVYGALCESACVSDSRRPYWREGLVLRLRPISLKLPTSTAVVLTPTHLRNRVASAYFASEPGATGSALSASGLSGGAWCQTTSLYGRDEVVIGLLARESKVNRFIDVWAGRRERMEAQARGYWQGRMAMRPWNVYLAQILQFQCQLSGVFNDSSVVVTPPESCDDLRAALESTRKELQALHKKYADSASKIVEKLGGKPSKADTQKFADEVKLSAAELAELSDKLSGLETGQGALPKNRLLLNSGFVQLPPAGYLPVQPGKTEITDQLSRLFGEGVRLTYRAARADVLPHLLEEAQHMERISLTQGLDHPDALEDVEVFVPDGRILDVAAQPQGLWWDTAMSPGVALLLSLLKLDGENTTTYEPKDGQDTVAAEAAPQAMASAADLIKERQGATGKTALRSSFSKLDEADLDLPLAGLTRTEARENGSVGLTLVAANDADAPRQQSWYIAADLAGDPFDLTVGDELAFQAELRLLTRTSKRSLAIDGRLQGALTLVSRQLKSQGRTMLVVELTGISVVGVHISDAEAQERSGHIKIRVGLVRQGDGSTGVLLIDDPQFSEQSAPMAVNWDDAPRVATLTLSTELAGTTPITHVAETPTVAQTVTLASLRGLPAAPSPASALGSAALNQIVALAEATEDGAFNVRARRRLFPSLETTGTQRIEAVHDWVMFRRLRPTFCNPVCATPVSTELETFEVWHTRIDSDKELQMLSSALEQGNADAIAHFKFQRVGMLRYRDDQTQSEESPSKIKALWQNLPLGQQVKLARAWETNPTAGQGWQNHFRLRTMLDAIASLTTPPAKGDGSVATLAKVPAPLSKAGFDGGFLVVTGGQQAQVLVSPHRVIYLRTNVWRELAAAFKQSPSEGWKKLQATLGNATFPKLDITLQVTDNTLSAANIQAVKQSEAQFLTMIGLNETAVQRMTVRLEANTLAEGEDIVAPSEAITQAVGAQFMQAIAIPEADLGGGAHGVTVVLHDAIEPQ
ncbi:MAG TPA: hypothetical protein VFW84_10010 [Aquabacterium sp.]|uniref:hypothetical protein n=1 Tax=Aquabacterium sp. TaxID=1872578 RepID=UPI002E3216F4|nr:hypothetical protein [Aquabacterium sp.]HEX5373056.1 hypothetical protein [Aquabacterium sp.]